MEEGVRSGNSTEVVIKNRNSSGCLVVRRKGDALAGGHLPSDSRKVYMSKKEKKRRMLLSDSGSSEEILGAPRRRVGPETVRVCNDLNAHGKVGIEEDESGRKRERSDGYRRNGDGFFGSNGLDESERKRTKLNVFDFDEYDSIDGARMRNPYYDERDVNLGGRRFPGAMQREFEAGSSRHIVDKRTNTYFERANNTNRGNHTTKSGLQENNRERSLLRDKFSGNSEQAIRLQGKNGVLKVLVNKKRGTSGSLEKYKFYKAEEHLRAPRANNVVRKTDRAPFSPEEKIIEKPRSAIRPEKKHVNSQKSLPTKNKQRSNWDSDDSEASLKPERENVVRSLRRTSVEHEDPPSSDKITPNKNKEAKLRRGSGTEKQKLRERIRGLLVDAGWTIDYRPRRNRDYLDAVYINPSGTAYWSIIKAYEALQKQVIDEENEPKPSAEGSSVKLIADEDLCQLTRKTRKKMEKEMKNKQRYGSDYENAKETRVKRSASKKHDSESMESSSHDEKLSSFMKQGGKSFKSRTNENGFGGASSNGRNLQDAEERQASGSNYHMMHGRKSRKMGRCTLLVRGSNKGQNSEIDGFVPYRGKRTVLSWIIDSGAVQLSQEIEYMNRRRTRMIQNGWITRDGIHCGCCNKILSVSKFELHIGSKLRQPYQNIFLAGSEKSLLDCQMDAWNRQEGSEHVGFQSVDTDGDDPNDDTCGICGDGGDLICCDGCPSTFHQGCLDIETPPPGDWHCPNCTCKFCGITAESETLAEEGDITSTLLSCSLCEKKYHESCVQDLDTGSVDSSSTDPSFCGQNCKELYEQLQRVIGIKHDLEAGFSWSLVRRTDEDSMGAHRVVSQRVECNSKLAVAMTVMDECFLPIVDRRSGFNLIRNVLYNCGSNFNRLNYTGFYTAILERGDEIICAASIRFHGTKLAEMPFIGTRHIYRRQGMCRRLFSVIESLLCSLKVEKLVIPAISELTHTWTEVFGFTPLEETLKHEMRSMNMLVFPGIDMLQKLLGELEHEANIAIEKDAKKLESEDKQYSQPEVVIKPDTDSLIRSDSKSLDNADLKDANLKSEEFAAVESGFQGVDLENNGDVSNDNSQESVKVEINSPTRMDPQECYNTDLNHSDETKKEDVAVDSGFEDVDVSDVKQDVSPKVKKPDPIETARSESPGGNILVMASREENFSHSETRPDSVVTENNPLPDIVLDDAIVPSVLSDVTPESENLEPIKIEPLCSASDLLSEAKILETTYDSKFSPPFHATHEDEVSENNPLPNPVPEVVTSVSSNDFLGTENPEPIKKRSTADILETISISENKPAEDHPGEDITEFITSQ